MSFWEYISEDTVRIDYKRSIAWNIFNKFKHLDRAMEVSDVMLWVEHYSFIAPDWEIYYRVIDKLREHDEYALQSELKCEASQKSSDEFDTLKYYTVMILDNVEDDIVNKIWFEELGLEYEREYDVNLVELILAGYKNKEIAEMLGLSEGRVSQMLKMSR